jgi:hypothetical protein
MPHKPMVKGPQRRQLNWAERLLVMLHLSVLF